ncbi:MAG: hypothetical protein FJZ07_00610 [Candidatus Nealsonbacteria bacterium]|nr:hypothetical protein [Candidatus Nealsonbacteria bacterium]
MAHILINNQSLENFVQGLKISPEKRDFLLEKIPEMDTEERLALFKTLTKIYLLDLKEKEAIERIKKFWEK